MWHVFLTFPTVFFTILLGIILAYWLLVIIGLLDIDGLAFEGIDGFFIGAGIAGMPNLISISLMVLSAWLFSLFGTYYVVLSLSNPWWQFLAGAVILFICLWLSAHVAVFLLYPLRGLFALDEGDYHSVQRLIGQTCEISTLAVDENYGQAIFEDHSGTSLVLSVRANTPNNLKKGAKALIVSYEASGHCYQITPLI
jgi:hypothetical protein